MKTLVRMLCLALIAVPLACDGGDREELTASAPEPASDAGEPSATDASPAAFALREKLPRELWIWPDARTAPPDLDADLLDCSSRLVEDPELSARSDLRQLGWILDCMSGRGWARNPDYAPSRG